MSEWSPQGGWTGVGGAGASTPVLVKPADPTDVPLTAGTTTSSASARTFGSPTGGSGSWTLAVTIDQAVGSGAVLDGDNSEGWYLTSLEDADAVKVIGTWTDDSTGQKVAASFLVVVEDGGASPWSVVVGSLRDWTGLDPATLSDNASDDVEKSSSPFETVYVYQTGGMDGAAKATAAGLQLEEATSGSGRRAVSWDDSDLIGDGTLDADDWKGMVAFQFLINGMTFDGAGERITVGIGTANDLAGAGIPLSAYWHDNGDGTVDVGMYTAGFLATVLAEDVAAPSTALVSIILVDGVYPRVEVTHGATSFADPNSGSETYANWQAGVSQSPGVVPTRFSSVRSGLAHFQEAGMTMPTSRILRRSV